MRERDPLETIELGLGLACYSDEENMDIILVNLSRDASSIKKNPAFTKICQKIVLQH